MENSQSSSRADRKLVERARRNQMKSLFSQLYSFIPHQSSKETTSLPDQLDEATTYIERLQTIVEKLKQKRDNMLKVEKLQHANRTVSNGVLKPTEIEIHEADSTLDIILNSSSWLDYQTLFTRTIRVLEEAEGIDIVNAGFSVIGATVFHSIHSEVGRSIRTSDAAAKVSERLQKLVSLSTHS